MDLKADLNKHDSEHINTLRRTQLSERKNFKWLFLSVIPCFFCIRTLTKNVGELNSDISPFEMSGKCQLLNEVESKSSAPK